MNNFIKPTVTFFLAGLLLVGLYHNSKDYNFFYDATNNSHNSLTETSISLLNTFKKPIELTLYSEDPDIILQAESIIKLYKRASSLIRYQYIDSAPSRELKDQYKFTSDGLIITIGEQTKAIDLSTHVLNEGILSQALFSLARKNERWVVFTEGHGEPSPFGKNMTDLSLFHLALKNQGIHVQTLNLARSGAIPNNTSLLVVGSAKNHWLKGEVALLKNYLDNGGNILLLKDPKSEAIPELFDWLGLEAIPGTIVDANGQKMGTPHPAITIITEYQNFKGTKNISELSAFPWAQAFKIKEEKNNNWKTQAFLKTHPQSWTETKLDNTIEYNPELGEVKGPLTIGIELNRMISSELEEEQIQQRVVVIGNSRFLSNNAIQNYGNLSLGLSLINWLNQDDALLNVNQPTPKDQLFQLPKWLEKVYLIGFITFLPVLILTLVFSRARKSRGNSLKAINARG